MDGQVYWEILINRRLGKDDKFKSPRNRTKSLILLSEIKVSRWISSRGWSREQEKTVAMENC